MHNLLLGVVQDHFRNVLSLTPRGASAVSPSRPAFHYEFTPVPADESRSRRSVHAPRGKDSMDDKDIEDVSKMHKRLVLPLTTTGRTGIASEEAFAELLAKCYRYRALEFVCNSLDISPQSQSNPRGKSRLCRAHWARALASWVSVKFGLETVGSVLFILDCGEAFSHATRACH